MIYIKSCETLEFNKTYLKIFLLNFSQLCFLILLEPENFRFIKDQVNVLH